MASSPFKVIILGGGPVGLTAAHALGKADIDFVLLERRDEIAIDVGASIVIGPGSLRVFHQLDILPQLMPLGGDVSHRKVFRRDGYAFKDGSPFECFKKNHGAGPVVFHRAELVQTIYDCLPEASKAKVLAGKKAIEIQSNTTGVRVTCSDGSVYDGNVVLGADGVHSKARSEMRRLALEADPKADWDSDKPFTSTYRCMWCSFKRPSASGKTFETQSKDRSIMYVSGKERGWIFLYEKLSECTQERVFYGEKDIEECAERFADWPITETLNVRDVYPQRMTAGMSNLEEGILKNWSWGRIVLAGDSCHKFTPNAGLGFNSGIQDVVALSNALREAVAAAGSEHPTDEALTQVFKAYQTGRWEMVQNDSDTSAKLTRLQAWADWFSYLFARFVMPLELHDYVVFGLLAGKTISKSLALDYVEGEEPFVGKVSWQHKLKSPSKALDS